MRTNRLLFVGVLLASSTVACGAILGFPDETNVDPNFGQTDGGGPDVTLPDGVAPDGSIPDGSTADSPFPTDAPVVSPDGACNCFGGTCNGDVCQPVAIVVGKTDPNFIDTDNTTVFFASGVDTIFAVDPNNVDAGARTITNVLEPSITDLRARSGYVYFTNKGSGNLNSVSRCSGALGCAKDRSEYGTNNRKNFGVAVDATNVYFTVADTQANNGGIWKCAQIGCAGAVRIVSRDYPGFVVTDGTNLAWLDGNTPTTGTSTTSGANFHKGVELALVDLAFGTTSDIYFVKSSELWHQVGTTESQIGGGVSNGVAVRADASYVYWLNGGTPGTLVRCPVGVNCLAPPSQATTLASNLQNPFGLALSNDSVYFTTRGDLKVWRLRK